MDIIDVQQVDGMVSNDWISCMRQHQAIFLECVNRCKCFAGFTSNVDHLVIGNVDSAEITLRELRDVVNELKEKMKV